SLSFDSALQALASLLSRIALAQFAHGALADDERASLAPYAEAFDAEYLQLAYQIAIHGRDELPLAPDEYTGLTMTLLRLHAFRPEQPEALGAPAAPGGGGAGRARPLPARAAPVSAPQAAAPRPQPSPDPVRAGVPVPEKTAEPPAPVPEVEP